MRTDGRKDRQTYMTKLRVVFRNFAKAPKNCDKDVRNKLIIIIIIIIIIIHASHV